MVSRDLKFYKIHAKIALSLWVAIKDLVHVCIYNPSTRSKHGRNFSFYSGNLPWYALVPVKFQIFVINISLKICFLSCLVITTFGTPIRFQSQISCISIRKNTIKNLHKNWNSFMVGKPPCSLVLKATRKVVLTAGTHTVNVGH